MMAGDSSIYWGNGVGAVWTVMREGEKRHGEPKLPTKSLCALIIFLLGFLFLLSALFTNLEACERPPNLGVKSKRIALVAEMMLIFRSNQFRCCF